MVEGWFWMEQTEDDMSLNGIDCWRQQLVLMKPKACTEYNPNKLPVKAFLFMSKDTRSSLINPLIDTSRIPPFLFRRMLFSSFRPS